MVFLLIGAYMNLARAEHRRTSRNMRSGEVIQQILIVNSRPAINFYPVPCYIFLLHHWRYWAVLA